jgi:hypothetical protein
MGGPCSIADLLATNVVRECHSPEREASLPRTPLLLLPDLLRNALASLAFALGFAALARRPGSRRTLLQELQREWRRSCFGGSGRRPRGSSGCGG